MNAMPFTARLASVIVLVVLAASALTISLDYLKFRRVLRNQEDLVYLFVADDLAGTIEDSMNLGISLPMLQTTQQVIQRRRDAEPGIAGITVFDANGTVLFDTERFRLESRVPASWLRPPGQVGDWRASLPERNLVGADLVNSFGQRAGGIVVRYDTTELDARGRAILLDMMEVALAAVAATAILAVVAATLLTRPLRRWFGRATAQLAVLSATQDGHPVEGSEALMASIADTMGALDEAEARLMELGTSEPGQSRAA